MFMQHFRSTALSLLLGIGAICADAQETLVAGDVQLKGLLGSKLKIELLLQCGHERPFFSQVDKNCLDLRGEYYYHTQVLPIRVEGRLCPANASFFLSVMDGVTETERFEGKWSPSTRQLTGTWRLKKTAKTMTFELTALEAVSKESNLKGFYGVVRELMTGEPDAEGASIEDAQWTAQGGNVVGFAPNWGGDVLHLSPGRFQYYTSYTSTARSSYYEETYQVLPSGSGVYVAHLSTYSGFEKDEEGNVPEGSSHCGSSFHVYQWIQGVAEEVTARVIPADMASMADGGENAEYCNGHLLHDAVLLPSGEKLYWDGNTFTR